jgi:hypothetical protein
LMCILSSFPSLLIHPPYPASSAIPPVETGNQCRICAALFAGGALVQDCSGCYNSLCIA